MLCCGEHASGADSEFHFKALMRRVATFLLLVACVGGFPHDLWSQQVNVDSAESKVDRVWIAPVESQRVRDAWFPPGSSTLEGTVQSIDADSLKLSLSNGTETSIASHRVERIEIAWANTQAREAMQLVASREYRAAIDAIPKAASSGVPRWQQLFMVGGVVQSADALVGTRAAGAVFLKNLAAWSPPALLYADMPLNWTSADPDRVLLDTAEQWLASDDENSKLLGASWLLLTPRRDAAKSALIALQSSENGTLAKLATAQTWRLTPPPETMAKLDEWRQFRDSLIEPLQIGPTELIADRLTRVGQVDLAIGEWMRIASVHGDRYHRASRALQTVADLLRRSDRNEEAKRLAPWIESLSGT